MIVEVDVRGLPCPRPVVETKKALERIEEGRVIVLVDNSESRQNVERFAQSQGCTVSISERDGGYCLDINDGVKLTTEGSEVLDALQLLEKKGVELFSCGTCLENYQLKEKLEVGLVTNMYDTVVSLLCAGKVIKI